MSVEDLTGQAEEEGAFNPETGEINWDCPCLGGMAHGPCGEEFKEAFSCFVFSNEEPKGIGCIDRFRAMQDCFRKHPDIYGSELEEDEIDAQLEEQIAAAADDHHPAPVSHPESTSVSEMEASSELVEKQTAQQLTKYQQWKYHPMMIICVVMEATTWTNLEILVTS
ncbi:hypothetical protein Egran_00454 [Elaphomyces granulatus]|uniref:Mitochondrial intermembrane space import and assembly protein 40 n=1 Tax=Elaphomyces granulatus TaxID=519963 RepID=A0A232M5Y0_9EURO|nr:hypothetical protein Egran_00454 [Elaphomyces granulatus]